MKKNIALTLLLLALLFGRGSRAFGLDGQPAPEAPRPDEDFLSFLIQFADDEAFQREHTQYPLTWLRLKEPDADIDYGEIVEELPRDRVRFPVFPSAQERTEWSLIPGGSLELTIENVYEPTHQVKVRVWIPDSDSYSVSFYFKKDGGWRLTRVEDWSFAF